jgi:hypothetical protein
MRIMIDEGPNSRRGDQPDSGTGAIYFYAHRKAYSHNGTEDTGDRATQDTDLQTNFGAWKDGKFRSIGRNDLARPMYNLDVVQFAEVVPKSDSSPEYVSRSVLQTNPMSADPGSWLTFDPKPDEPFRRGPVTPVYYPDEAACYNENLWLINSGAGAFSAREASR